MLCALFLQFGLGMQRTIFSNFVSEELAIRPEQLGWLESVREIPGLLTFLMVGITVFLARNVVVAIAVGFVSLGLAFYAGAGDLAAVVVATSIYSVGFHMFFPLQSAQVLSQAGPGEKARRLGELNSVAALAYLLAMGFVYLTAGRLNYRQLFAVAAVVVLGGVITMLLLPRTRSVQKSRGFVMRRKYWLYYVLTFLASTRRQVGSTFVIFALVRIYGSSVKTIAALMFVSNVLAVLTRSLCGQLVDRLGEARIMAFSYTAIIGVFLGYAFIPIPAVLYVLYIFDNFLLGFDVSQFHLSRPHRPSRRCAAVIGPGQHHQSHHRGVRADTGRLPLGKLWPRGDVLVRGDSRGGFALLRDQAGGDSASPAGGRPGRRCRGRLGGWSRVARPASGIGGPQPAGGDGAAGGPAAQHRRRRGAGCRGRGTLGVGGGRCRRW